MVIIGSDGPLHVLMVMTGRNSRSQCYRRSEIRVHCVLWCIPTESVGSYWVGAEDVTGQEDWSWVDGGLLPGGPPYWASGQPSHNHDNQPWEHCAVMDADMRYYLRDAHCTDRHPYICKLTKVKPKPQM